ncbi:MAG: CDP-diacylglycerol--glycerol-3-phosphate 3-phosphatidyltransferase [Ruminiclostridium sp.]|nr:CDP-diacylglycerol--glycerol-3-phosphate 3-phosphatidyltransferase [Ruminiclostridium sp.]
MNVPNILTVVRFLLIPVFAYFLWQGDYYTSVFLFLLAGLTDVLDGFIARKYNLITPWGKLADPLADKLMQITALIILSIVKELIPAELLAIVIAKEIFMGIGAILLLKQNNYVVSANWYGKLATIVFYFAIIMIIFKAPYPYSSIFIYIAVLSTLFAFVMYVRTFRQIKSGSEKNTNT